MSRQWSNRLSVPVLVSAEVRAALLARCEIALIDVREEDAFAREHPLFAVQLSAGRIEQDAPWRLPRRDVLIVVYDDGEGLAEGAARTLATMGYSQVYLLAECLQSWRDAGGELFRDVNVPSKAFGELVEHVCRTPSLPAEAVKVLIEDGADVMVLDVRRFEEYQTMSIPSAISVPGAELVLRVRELAPNPKTRVIVNCAGRTRSIIGAQSLINAGIPNPVAALRNGTIGWKLAGFELDYGQQRRFGAVSGANQTIARNSAQRLAERSGALKLNQAGLADWASDRTRTLYCWDVRTPEEYSAGHIPGFGSAPGGQLIQETDVFCAVRGARIVLSDSGSATDGVRAAMTAHWLAQLGWEVAWLTDDEPIQFSETGPWRPAYADAPPVAQVAAAQLADQLQQGGTLLLDVTTSDNYIKGHIPGAWWILRSQLVLALKQLPASERIVVTCRSDALAQFAAADLARLTETPVKVLEGGTTAWAAEGRPLVMGETRLASPRIDRYCRPYEGTDASGAAMQAYLDWEFGLLAQLTRDGTHNFKVLTPMPGNGHKEG